MLIFHKGSTDGQNRKNVLTTNEEDAVKNYVLIFIGNRHPDRTVLFLMSSSYDKCLERIIWPRNIESN